MKWKIFATCLLTLPAAASPASGSEESTVRLLHAGILLNDAREAPIDEATLVIVDERIEAVRSGYVTPAEAGYPEAHVDDYRDKFVLPGLLDMHVHLSLVGPEGVHIDDSVGAARALAEQEADIRSEGFNLVNASVNARKTLAAGFTTVRNIGDFGWHVFALRDAINQGLMDGPRILNAGAIIRIGTDDGSGSCSGVESCRRAVREQIDKGADVIKVYATCSGSKPCGHADAPALFLDDEIEAVVATARTRELTVAAHAHGTAGINAALRAGVDSIEHGSANDRESHRLFKKGGAYLVPTVSVVLDRVAVELEDAEEPMRSVMQNFVDQHPKRLLAAHKAGVLIAAGSDAGVVAHGDNARELFGYVESGLSNSEALVTATINGAALIGKSSDLGTLEVGKLADILVIDGNPLTTIEDLDHVVVVYKDGHPYFPAELLRGIESPEPAEETD